MYIFIYTPTDAFVGMALRPDQWCKLAGSSTDSLDLHALHTDDLQFALDHRGLVRCFQTLCGNRPGLGSCSVNRIEKGDG